MAGKAVVSLSTGHALDGEAAGVACAGGLLPNAELAGSVQLWEWIGDEGATTFSY